MDNYNSDPGSVPLCVGKCPDEVEMDVKDCVSNCLDKGDLDEETCRDQCADVACFVGNWCEGTVTEGGEEVELAMGVAAPSPFPTMGSTPTVSDKATSKETEPRRGMARSENVVKSIIL